MQANDNLSNWTTRKCQACKPGTPALTRPAVKAALADLPGWTGGGKSVAKTYSFKDYYHTMAFVNAVASIAHAEDHHPDLTVGYNKCTVTYSTHSVGGVSENDLICAAKVEQWAAATAK